MKSGDGLECIDCEPYTRAQENHSLCAADPCFDYQITTNYGTCYTCQEGTKQDPSRQKCLVSQPETSEKEKEKTQEEVEDSVADPSFPSFITEVIEVETEPKLMKKEEITEELGSFAPSQLV